MEKETCSVSKHFWEYMGKWRGIWQEHIKFWGAELNKGEAASSFLGRGGRKEMVDLNFTGGGSFILLLAVSLDSESSPNMYYKISRPEKKK